MAEQHEQRAERMFNAYNEQGPNPWKTFDGRDVPRWPDLTDQVRAKWVAAATAADVLEELPPESLTLAEDTSAEDEQLLRQFMAAGGHETLGQRVVNLIRARDELTAQMRVLRELRWGVRSLREVPPQLRAAFLSVEDAKAWASNNFPGRNEIADLKNES